MSVIDHPELATRLDCFAAAWGVLSRMLRAPADAGLLAVLGEPGQLDSWPLDRDERTERGLQLLSDSLGQPEALIDLERDYDQLFVGPGPLLATPYESVYLSNEHLIFQAPTRAVRAAYAEFDLAISQLDQEPDDHIGLELAFLAHLCGLALDRIEAQDPTGLGQCLDSHAAFLDEHVLRWGPECLAFVEEHAQTRFYRGVAALALAALEQSKPTRLR